MSTEISKYTENHLTKSLKDITNWKPEKEHLTFSKNLKDKCQGYFSKDKTFPNTRFSAFVRSNISKSLPHCNTEIMTIASIAYPSLRNKAIGNGGPWEADNGDKTYNYEFEIPINPDYQRFSIKGEEMGDYNRKVYKSFSKTYIDFLNGVMERIFDKEDKTTKPIRELIYEAYSNKNAQKSLKTANRLNISKIFSDAIRADDIEQEQWDEVRNKLYRVEIDEFGEIYYMGGINGAVKTFETLNSENIGSVIRSIIEMKKVVTADNKTFYDYKFKNGTKFSDTRHMKRRAKIFDSIEVAKDDVITNFPEFIISEGDEIVERGGIGKFNTIDLKEVMPKVIAQIAFNISRFTIYKNKDGFPAFVNKIYVKEFNILASDPNSMETSKNEGLELLDDMTSSEDESY